jgi:hypothetical protein
MTSRRLSVAVLLALAITGCSHEDAPVFQPLPSPAGTTSASMPPERRSPGPSPGSQGQAAPPALPSAPSEPVPVGSPPPPYDRSQHSRFDITGELRLRLTSDLDCTEAKDDYFVRGLFDLGKGYQLAMSVNVEHYTGPGEYDKTVQVLIRRLRGTTYYASWYTAVATATVAADRHSVDMSPVELPPEQGTASTRSISIRGHLGCQIS